MGERNNEEWWYKKKDRLLSLADRTPLFVYDMETIQNSLNDLKRLTAVDSLFYAIKANWNPQILKHLEKNNINFEVVSPGELKHILNLFPDINTSRILFTPNFIPKKEYEFAFEKGALVTVDCLYPLKHWPSTFQEREIIVRLDPGFGDGHHDHVITGGVQSKFGISLLDIEQLAEAVNAINAKVIGLHCHAGSGIKDPDMWVNVAETLAAQKKYFPHLKYLDVGGGLSVGSKEEERNFIDEVNKRLLHFKEKHPDLSLWMEPGRYYVANSAVLLGSVTQIKSKGDSFFVGIDMGFNTLIRPILYDAYHHIANLSKIDYEGPTMRADIVGTICESGDVFGKDRILPATTEGNDIFLIATAGAYGRSMSSHYNLRDPAEEYFLED